MRCKEVTTQLKAEMDRMRQQHAAEVRQAAEAAKAKEQETLKSFEADKAAAVDEAVTAAKKEVEAEYHK